MTTQSFNAQTTTKISSYVFVVETDEENVALNITDATIKIPSEDIELIRNANLKIPKGAKVAFTGPNGSGKTSLFRVLRGLWHAGSGQIALSSTFNENNIICASQQIRQASTTLPGLLAYRNAPDKYTHEEYETVLEKVGLKEQTRHLPWNAAAPENVLRFAKTFLDDELEVYKGCVSQGFIDDFIKSFSERFSKKLSVPAVLEAYFTEEFHGETVKLVSGYARESLEQAPKSQEETLVLFTSRAGRIAANHVAEKTRYALDTWLLQGQRMKLSGGQQQMMVFARILLQKPQFMLLDEITSALKEDKAKELYQLLLDELPDSTFISVIHNDYLLPFHTHHMELHPDKSLTLTEINEAYLKQLSKPQVSSDANKPSP